MFSKLFSYALAQRDSLYYRLSLIWLAAIVSSCVYLYLK
jgi:hypothetical protein